MTATYGDLVGQAGVDVHTGLLRVMRRGFVDKRQAQNTVGAYYDLIAALRSHTWRLLDPQRVRTLDLLKAGQDAGRDDLDSVAVRTFQVFGPLDERPTWLPYPDADFDHPWREAAVKLAAAADLLDTHLGPQGLPRSEQAAMVADPHQRRGALTFVAQLTSLTLNADSAIGAACRHRDIPWDTVHRWLPDRTAAKDLAHRMHDLATKHEEHPGLRDVTVNIYPVREGDPILELGDRMLRLRHGAWGLAGANPDYSVVTLHDLAGLGMTANLHAAAAHGIDVTAHTPAPHRLVTTARTFLHLTADLRDYMAPGPPDPEIRTDVLAACRLLAELAHTDRPGYGLHVADAQTRQTLSALHGACDVMGQIARMNRASFATLARSDQIHVPTRLLSGQVLSEDATTAAAKLAGTQRVVAPPARVRQTVQLYDAIADATGHVGPYQPAPVHAANYDPPALFRRAEFEGRP
jgi:hypothetical protein